MSLVVKVICAKLSRDTNLISTMDPFCAITLGNQKLKTKVHKQGGKKPVWNQTLTFTKSMDVFMKVGVYDSQLVGQSQVGVTTVNMRKYVQQPNFTHNETIILNHKGKKAGQLVVTVEYNPGNNVNACVTQSNFQPWNYQPYQNMARMAEDKPWPQPQSPIPVYNGPGAQIPQPSKAELWSPQQNTQPQHNQQNPYAAIGLDNPYSNNPYVPSNPPPQSNPFRSGDEVNYDAIWESPSNSGNPYETRPSAK